VLHFKQIFKKFTQQSLQVFVGTGTIRSNLLILQPRFNKVDWKHACYTNNASDTTIDDTWQHTTKNNTLSTLTPIQEQQQLLLLPFYGHYTGQPTLAEK